MWELFLADKGIPKIDAWNVEHTTLDNIKRFVVAKIIIREN